MNPFIVVGFVGVFAVLVKCGVLLIKRQRGQRSAQAKFRGTLARRDKDFARVFGSPRRGR